MTWRRSSGAGGRPDRSVARPAALIAHTVEGQGRLLHGGRLPLAQPNPHRRRTGDGARRARGPPTHAAGRREMTLPPGKALRAVFGETHDRAGETRPAHRGARRRRGSSTGAGRLRDRAPGPVPADGHHRAGHARRRGWPGHGGIHPGRVVLRLLRCRPGLRLDPRADRPARAQREDRRRLRRAC